MSDVVTAAQAQPEAGASPRPRGHMRWVRRIGYCVLGLELAGFIAWSAILYRRFALTFDFAVYDQAFFQITHGHLNPFDTLGQFDFWQNHSEFMLWLLALISWPWPHGVILLWLQDLSLAGAMAVAFNWLCEIAERNWPARKAPLLAGAGLVLLAANPWLWWAVSYDFHMEMIAVLFVALLARDLAHGRRRAWAWVVPLFACGDVATTYLVALGLAGVLAGRRTRVAGVIMAAIGLVVLWAITLLHGDLGAGGGLRTYAYLTTVGRASAPLSIFALAKGMAAHPLRVARAVWTKRVDVLANLAPPGLLGICYPLILPLVVLVLLENTLFPGEKFAEPIFQYIPVYLLLPVGTVGVLGRVARRHPAIALTLACVLAAQAFGWTAVWARRTPGQWLRVPAPVAAAIASVQARIPGSAEVIASQGIVGRFAGRSDVRSLSVPGAIPIRPRGAWFVITPWDGIEIQAPSSAMALIGELAGPLHATLVTHANGVWAFRWRPPPGVHAISVPGLSSPLPAWVSPGAGGRASLTGPAGTWSVSSTGARGYVADRLEWLRPPGRYRALVTLSAAGPVNIEVWNNTGKVLLARQSVPATAGIESVALPVAATVAYRARSYGGWGPFHADFVQPPEGEVLEARVWSPGGTTVNVYSAELTREHGGTPRTRS